MLENSTTISKILSGCEPNIHFLACAVDVTAIFARSETCLAASSSDFLMNLVMTEHNIAPISSYRNTAIGAEV